MERKLRMFNILIKPMELYLFLLVKILGLELVVTKYSKERPKEKLTLVK